MSQMDELQSRITAALERIGAGLDAMSAAAEERGKAAGAAPASEPAADPEVIARLQSQLDEERLANAQLEARVKALKERLEQQDAVSPQAGSADVPQELSRLDEELSRLRQANEKLRESNAALREANAAGVGEPHLINGAMLAELESMRALRASEAAEASSIMEQLVPLLGGARNLPEGEDA